MSTASDLLRELDERERPGISDLVDVGFALTAALPEIRAVVAEAEAVANEFVAKALLSALDDLEVKLRGD